MKDTVTKGTGNSRSLRTVPNALTLYPTYESMMQALITGSFPVDLGQLNPAGLTQKGNDLNKANLCSDALCSALGLPTTATPTQAMEKLRQMAVAAQSAVNARAMCEVVSYTGTGVAKTESNPMSIKFSFAPKLIICTYDENGSVAQYDRWLWPTDVWGTSYTPGKNFGPSRTGNSDFSLYTYGKKSTDGKSFYWYGYARRGTETPTAYVLNNLANKVYRYIGIG